MAEMVQAMGPRRREALFKRGKWSKEDMQIEFSREAKVDGVMRSFPAMIMSYDPVDKKFLLREMRGEKLVVKEGVKKWEADFVQGTKTARDLENMLEKGILQIISHEVMEDLVEGLRAEEAQA